MASETIKHPGINLGAHHGHAHDKAETLVFGFWVFLMSDLIIFGLMFANCVTQLPGTAGGPGPKDLFSLGSAFVQTMVLLACSVTFGMASLALILTLIPFGVVAWSGWSSSAALWLIAGFALVQIVVHFRFFLHIDLSRQKREGLQFILFTVLLLAIMASGTIWIMASLQMRMM